MKNISLILPLMFLQVAVFAQNSEIWKKDGNNEIISTLESYSPGQIDPPVIFLKYSYDDENGSEPGGSAESGEIIEKNFGLFNEGALKIKFSGGGNYSSLVEFSNGLTKFNTGINVTGTSFVSGLAWNQDDVFVENGSIGIGISLSQLLSMNEKFLVQGSSRFNGNVFIDENLSANTISAIDNSVTFKNDLQIEEHYSLQFGWGLDKHNDAGKIGYQLYSDGLDIIGAAEQWPNRKIRLWDKVLIGPNGADVNGTHADYTLAVNGKIVSRSVVCRTDNWADYVFEDSYGLMSLNEVEKYINDNGHLPNIPSAKEVIEQGIDLGEMNRMLMIKIEELTLHMIQLEKRIEVLNN